MYNLFNHSLTEWWCGASNCLLLPKKHASIKHLLHYSLYCYIYIFRNRTVGSKDIDIFAILINNSQSPFLTVSTHSFPFWYGRNWHSRDGDFYFHSRRMNYYRNRPQSNEQLDKTQEIIFSRWTRTVTPERRDDSLMISPAYCMEVVSWLQPREREPKQ